MNASSFIARGQRPGCWLWFGTVTALLSSTCAHPPQAGGSGSADKAGATTAQTETPAQSPLSAASVPPTTNRVPASGPDAIYWANRTDLIRPPAQPPALELALPRIETWTLKNGLSVVAVPRRGLPVVSFGVAIKAGGYDEQKDRNQGIADFVAAMLRKGTRKRGADAIADAIDGAGGSLDAAASMESSMVSCSVLSKRTALCLDLLSQMLLAPSFPQAEIEEIRDQILASLAARTDDPHQLAAEHFDNLLFGEDHPDGWILTEGHVRAVTRDALLAFWGDFYRPNNAILAVAGDFDPVVMKAALTRALGGWKPAPIRARPTFQVPAVQGTRVIVVDKPDLSQATLMFGHPGLRHGDADWYAATLVNYVLGGSDLASRLMAEVRSKRGLTYGIGSSFGATIFQGAFRISAATRNETARDALTVSIEQVRKMKAEGPTSAELDRAKGYYAGSIPFELESAAGIARKLVAAELHGLGTAYVRQLPVRLGAVDVQAARAAASARLHPDDMAIVIVGKAAVIEPQLRQARPARYERVDYRAPISAAARRVAATPAPGPAEPAPAPAPAPAPNAAPRTPAP